METFTRLKKKAIPFNYTNKDGVAVAGTEDTSDVVLIGVVKAVSTGTSAKGLAFTRIVLAGESTKAFDEELGIEIDIDVPDQNVYFYDTTFQGKKNPASTNVNKLKLDKHVGTIIAIKGTKTARTTADGEESVSYMGSRAFFPGSKIEFRDGVAGPGAWIFFGRVSAKEANGTNPASISMPLQLWDADAKENYNLWATFTDINGNVEEDVISNLAKEENKSKCVAFVVNRPDMTEADSPTGRATAISGKFTDYFVTVTDKVASATPAEA